VRPLLDEMYSAAVAEGLRKRGHDVVAVQEVPSLRRLADSALFEHAQRDRRAVVTENVRDFMPLDGSMHQRGVPHHGLIFTTNRKFPRHRESFIGQLVNALDQYLEAHPGDDPLSIVHFL